MFFNLALIIFLSPLLFWMATFIYTAKRGSPYVPIKTRRYDNILKFVKPGDKVADLGCGDGRILVEAVKKGAKKADGWELDALVYVTALWRTAKAGLSKSDRSKIHIIFGDFWNADLSKYNVIYCYQMTKYLKPFQTKLLPQLKPGTLVISPDYEIPGMRYWKKVEDQDRGIYVYKI